MSKAEILRHRMMEERVLEVVGAHDGLGARFVERHDFDAVWASGFEISASNALPDANILTMSEFLAAAEAMNDACTIPVIADCDTGFGNSNNVMHLVRKYEAAGIAGICIEDKKFPKVNSYIPGRQELAPIGEFVGKIMAAKSAQKSKEFVIIARVEALIAGWGQEEALKRASAYAEAGADMILMHSKKDTDQEIREFLARWQKRLPVVIVPTAYPNIDLRELAELGIKVVIYANHGIRAAAKAMDDVLRKIRQQGGIAGLTENDVLPMSLMFDLQGMTRMKEVEKEYLSRDKAVILAAGPPNNPSLAPVLGDRPVAMLDIRGKSLLKRNTETLNICGVQDITVVSGYRAEAVDAEGVGKIDNPDYEDTGSAASLMCAEVTKADRVLVLYGDVLLDRHLIARTLETDGDIVIVVDDSYKATAFDRNIDRVTVRKRGEVGLRKVDGGFLPEIERIGDSVDEPNATHEFVGVAIFSARAFQDAREILAGDPQGLRWSVPELIHRMMREGVRPRALAVNSGWKEIHTFQHYREACIILG